LISFLGRFVGINVVLGNIDSALWAVIRELDETSQGDHFCRGLKLKKI
jgi:hypothetical protein